MHLCKWKRIMGSPMSVRLFSSNTEPFGTKLREIFLCNDGAVLGLSWKTHLAVDYKYHLFHRARLPLSPSYFFAYQFIFHWWNYTPAAYFLTFWRYSEVIFVGTILSSVTRKNACYSPCMSLQPQESRPDAICGGPPSPSTSPAIEQKKSRHLFVSIYKNLPSLPSGKTIPGFQIPCTFSPRHPHRTSEF